MEKQIRDYLHLYLGCQVEYDDRIGIIHQYFLPAGKHREGEVWFCSLEENGNPEMSCSVPCTKVKPILRPLSDMTEDEAIRVTGLSEYAPNFTIVKVTRNEYKDLIVSWKGLDDVPKEFNATGELFFCAEQFQYLLSKHFDIFGLIEDGLAIDKTKI